MEWADALRYLRTLLDREPRLCQRLSGQRAAWRGVSEFRFERGPRNGSRTIVRRPGDKYSLRTRLDRECTHFSPFYLLEPVRLAARIKGKTRIDR